MAGGRIHVSDQAVVRHSAGGPDRRGGIVGAGVPALAEVEIGADGEVAGGGEGAVTSLLQRSHPACGG